MSISGAWKLAVNSPMGAQKFTVDFHEDAGVVTGTLTNDGNGLTTDILEGRMTGDAVEWKNTLKQMRMTLAFAVTVDGDELDGKVKAGMFGKFKVHGERVLSA